MLECLLGVILVAIVVLILVYVVEVVVSSIGPIPGQVWTLVRLFAALFVLIYALRCFGLHIG